MAVPTMFTSARTAASRYTGHLYDLMLLKDSLFDAKMDGIVAPLTLDEAAQRCPVLACTAYHASFQRQHNGHVHLAATSVRTPW